MALAISAFIASPPGDGLRWWRHRAPAKLRAAAVRSRRATSLIEAQTNSDSEIERVRLLEKDTRMISYKVQVVNAPQNVPMLSGKLTREEAEAYRQDLIENRGVREFDVWIVKVEEKEAA